MTYLKSALTCAALGALFVGCTSTPERIPELDNARAQVQRVAADPLAQEAAGPRLHDAQQALQLADAAVEKRAPLEEIKQDAYVAERHAQVAEAQIREARARKEIDNSKTARNEVLLDARTEEANAASARAAAEKAQADAARSQTAMAQAEADDLRAKVAALEGQQTERGMVLTLGDVLFDTARATLKPGAMTTLDRLADFMKQNDKIQLLIEGHADSQGSAEYNTNLSAQRAMAVQAALQDRGVSSQRLRTRGLGEEYPVASNDSAAGRQQNRRVEVIFSDDQGHFMPAAERTAAR